MSVERDVRRAVGAVVEYCLRAFVILLLASGTACLGGSNQGGRIDATTTDASTATATEVTTTDSAAPDDVATGPYVPTGQACGEGLPACPAERPVCESVYRVCVACEVQSSCGTNAWCNERWECEEEDRCITDLECIGSPNGPHCTPGRIPIYGVTDRWISARKVCAECTHDHHCPAEERCASGRCKPTEVCRGPWHCPASAPHCTSLRCHPCGVDSHCAEDERCLDGECVAREPKPKDTTCDDDGDCLVFGVRCDPESGRCAPCKTNDDCPETRFCDVEAGACRRDLCVGGETRCVSWCLDNHLGTTMLLPFGLQCPDDDFQFFGLTALEVCRADGSIWEPSTPCHQRHSGFLYCRDGACLLGVGDGSRACRTMREHPICTSYTAYATCGTEYVENHWCDPQHVCIDGTCHPIVIPELD